MNATKATIDHDTIRHWAEERGAWPARVKGTGSRNDVGMIRLDFPGFSGKESLEQISWEQFFDKFEETKLALVYRDELTQGGRSNFNKLVGRETIDVSEGSGRRTAMARRRAKQAEAGGESTAAPKARTRRAPARAGAAKAGGRKRAGAATKRAGAKRGAASTSKAATPRRSARAGAARTATSSQAPAKRKTAQGSPRGRAATTRASGRPTRKGTRRRTSA